jgi:hypothetical protein
MKKKLALVVAAIGLVLIGGTVHAASVSVPTDEAQDRLVVRGGVIRIGKSVYVHSNSTHAAVGIRSVQLINRCDLRVNLEGAGGEQIVSAIAEEDETMARLNIMAGTSGGARMVDIRLYRAGRRICANSKELGNSSNIWLNVTYLRPAAA